MVNIDKTILQGLRNYMTQSAMADLDGSNANIKLEDYTRHKNLLLKAYNVMQRDEFACEEYLYSTDNNEDMISLLKNGFSIWDIQKVIYDEFPFIQIENKDGKSTLRSIDGVTLEIVLRGAMCDLMSCVLIYAPYVKEYADVYKEYVSCRLDKDYNV